MRPPLFSGLGTGIGSVRPPYTINFEQTPRDRLSFFYGKDIVVAFNVRFGIYLFFSFVLGQPPREIREAGDDHYVCFCFLRDCCCDLYSRNHKER